MDIGRLRISTQNHEGCKLTAYQDSRKIWTIGYGTNLQTLKIDLETADKFFTNGLQNAIVAARMFPVWASLDTDARQNAFIEMVYNMGALKVSGFVNMLAAIKVQDWETAAKQGMASDWSAQVGHRAVEITEMLRTGKFQS